MDPISLVIAIVVIGVLAWVAFWIIDRAFPEPIRTPAKVIVGLVLLLALLGYGGLMPRWRA